MLKQNQIIAGISPIQDNQIVDIAGAQMNFSVGVFGYKSTRKRNMYPLVN